jgi:hypothetical protein
MVAFIDAHRSVHGGQVDLRAVADRPLDVLSAQAEQRRGLDRNRWNRRDLTGGKRSPLNAKDTKLLRSCDPGVTPDGHTDAAGTTFRIC